MKTMMKMMGVIGVCGVAVAGYSMMMNKDKSKDKNSSDSSLQNSWQKMS